MKIETWYDGPIRLRMARTRLSSNVLCFGAFPLTCLPGLFFRRQRIVEPHLKPSSGVNALVFVRP